MSGIALIGRSNAQRCELKKTHADEEGHLETCLLSRSTRASMIAT